MDVLDALNRYPATGHQRASARWLPSVLVAMVAAAALTACSGGAPTQPTVQAVARRPRNLDGSILRTPCGRRWTSRVDVALQARSANATGLSAASNEATSGRPKRLRQRGSPAASERRSLRPCACRGRAPVEQSAREAMRSGDNRVRGW